MTPTLPYTDFDRELSANQSILTGKDIIHEVLGNSADVSSNEDDMTVSSVYKKALSRSSKKSYRNVGGI